MVATGLALGAVLGFVLQRGRFCVTGMLRDIFTQKSWRGFTALLIVIAVHAVGLAALNSADVISAKADSFAPLAVILGAFIFGLGIVLAGGCASGTWYRSGEGLVGSWMALITYGLSAAAMKAGALKGLNTGLSKHTVGASTIHGSLGISIWWLVIPFTALTAFLAARFLKQEFSQPKMASLTPKKTGLAHILTEKPWHFYTTAVIVGIIGVIAWPLSAAAGRNSGLGITTPSSDLIRYLTTGDAARLNWGAMLVLGILVGSFVAAKASGEFRVRMPDAKQAVRSLGGGVLMGVGAAWAGGCTVGNGMVQTSLFGYQGWVGLVFMALGVGVAAKLWLKPTQPINAHDVQVRTPAQPDAGEVAVTTPADGAHADASAGQAVTAGTPGAAEQWSTLTAPVALKERPLLTSASTPRNNGLRAIGEGKYALDTLGAVCPFPLIDAKDAMQRLEVGEELVIDFDCTQATDSIPRWAAMDGHEVTNYEATDDAGWTITVKKGR